MKKILAAVALAAAFLFPVVAQANCIQASQTALTAAQAVTAWSISRYAQMGDPYYDQWFSGCGRDTINEWLCNAGLNLTVRYAERKVDPDTHSGKLVCDLTWIGAAAFTYVNRHAIGFQLHLKL